MGYSPRYHIGYNRPVKWAFGNSPQEWHHVSETDNLEIAESACRRERRDHPKAFIFDTHTKQAIEPRETQGGE